MGWIAISDSEEHRFSAGGIGADGVPSLCDGALARGSLVLETRLSADGRPQLLLSYERLYPRRYRLSLQALPGGALALVIADGAEVFHTTLANPGEARADILRITYSWDTGSGDTGAAPGWGRLSVERPEHDKAVSRELTGAPPLFMEDIRIMATDRRLRHVDENVLFFAVSDAIEPVGPMPSLTAEVPLLVPGGYAYAGKLRRGDMVETFESGPQPVLHIVERTVPACGSFRPVRLRAPYFGLVSDIVVAPDQRLVVGGSEVEYIFGREAVLVPARHLVNGISAIELTGAVTMTYRQIVLPRHESLIAAGCPVESLYLGRIRRKPERLAASLLAGADRKLLPEHAPSAWLTVRPFEAITLMQRRAA